MAISLLILTPFHLAIKGPDDVVVAGSDASIYPRLKKIAFADFNDAGHFPSATCVEQSIQIFCRL